MANQAAAKAYVARPGSFSYSTNRAVSNYRLGSASLIAVGPPLIDIHLKFH